MSLGGQVATVGGWKSWGGAVLCCFYFVFLILFGYSCSLMDDV